MLVTALYIVATPAIGGLIAGLGSTTTSSWIGVILAAASAIWWVWTMGIAFQPLTGGWLVMAAVIVALSTGSFFVLASVGMYFRETSDSKAGTKN